MVWFNAIGSSAGAVSLKNTGTTGSSGDTGTTGNSGTSGNSGTTGTSGTSETSTSSSAAVSRSSEVQDRFLQLLVAQMRNQDPLNPLENAEVTAQMAQISTVEGIEKMNKTLNSYVEATGMNRASSSTGLIGQDVFVPGNALTWDTEASSMQGGVTVSDEASQVVVELLDAGGKVVDKRTFTNQSAGTIGIEWNGRGINGSYGPGDYVMRATVMSDVNATATTLTTNRVTGVIDSAAGVMAILANGEQIAISKINGVFQSRTGTTDKSQA